MDLDADRALERLHEASRALENEECVVELAARTMVAACPRAVSLSYTIRGRPAQAVGAIKALGLEGLTSEVDVDVFRQLYPSSPPYYDRYFVDTSQRDRWMDLPTDWFRACGFKRALVPFGYMARVVVCLGARPLSCVGLLLGEEGPAFTGQERQRLRKVASGVVAPVRVAALLAEAGSNLDALDHLLASRTDAAFLVSGSGSIVGATEPGRLELDRHPALRAEIVRVSRGSSARASSFLLDSGHEVHVSPCSPRGGASCALAVLDEGAPPGRLRLSRRQAELLDLLRLGLSNAEIGARMELATATVKTMLERLFRRAGVSGRVALLRWAERGGAEEPRYT